MEIESDRACKSKLESKGHTVTGWAMADMGKSKLTEVAVGGGGGEGSWSRRKGVGWGECGRRQS